MSLRPTLRAKANSTYTVGFPIVLVVAWLFEVQGGQVRRTGDAASHEPHTGWLPGEIDRDTAGYVLTGADRPGGGPPGRPAWLFETSLPGVFAVGDVRHGSVKRVASAVGEGAVAIRMVHEYLSRA